MIKFPTKICGKPFSHTDIDIVREILTKHSTETRAGLSRITCQRFGWFTVGGRLKEMSCRVAMLKLHKAGLIKLPPPKCTNTNGRIKIQVTPISDPAQPITKTVSELGHLSVVQVRSTGESQLWNQLIHRYHYLGYKPLPGAQIRYLIRCKDGLLSALGFSASAWKIAPRDNWIGWNDLQRKEHLQLIVNNSRFLILPWVQSQNLASKILSLCAKKLLSDWLTRYGYKPVLLETFVEKNKFHGTCYRAANWILVGQTKGRGKKDYYHQHLVPIKDIWLYPLIPNFRKVMCD